jgi:hypothetical protein
MIAITTSSSTRLKPWFGFEWETGFMTLFQE